MAGQRDRRPPQRDRARGMVQEDRPHRRLVRAPAGQGVLPSVANVQAFMADRRLLGARIVRAGTAGEWEEQDGTSATADAA